MAREKEIKDSFFRRANAMTKIIYLLLGFVSISLSNSWPLMISSTLFVVITGIIAKSSFLSAIKRLRGVVAFALFIFLLNSFFYSDRDPIFSFWIFHLTYDGMRNGAFFSFMIVMLSVFSSLVFSATHTRELGDGIVHLIYPLRHIGVNVGAVSSVLTLSLSFIPFLIQEAKEIERAAEARRERRTSKIILVFSITIPMFLSAFRRSDELSTAMEARGFRGVIENKERLSFSSPDYILLFFSTLYLIMVIAFLIIRRKI